MNDSVFKKSKQIIKEGQKNCFFIFDPKSITSRIALWEKLLPDIEMFYAMKAN